MTDLESESRLSQINTNWTQLFATRQGRADTVLDAQRELLLQYSGAVFRYLAAAVRDHDVADDLAQEFAVRFLRGDFRSVDPQRGRFRDFLKQSLRNLVTDHFRRQRTERATLQNARSPTQAESDLEGTFDESWTQELLSRTWRALESYQAQSGTVYYEVLKFRAEHPDENVEQLVEGLASLLHKADVNAAWVRQNLHRARNQFVKLLRDEVRLTLRDDSDSGLENELAELGLLKYVV